MSTYYVGSGGNDGNSGLTWALRKLTLNGAEDVPVVANDTVYVGPGVYRETLAVDVSGNAGNPITYIGDVTGESTDDIGGIVRVTGSDNDQSAARSYCINSDGKNYRTFRGFVLDTYSDDAIRSVGSPTNWIVEDCVVKVDGSNGIRFYGDNQSTNVVRRCAFFSQKAYVPALKFSSPGGCANSASVVENCLFVLSYSTAIDSDDVGGITVRNCTAIAKYLLYISDALPGGYTACTVNNSIMQANYHAVEAQVLGEIVEDYNTFYGNNTDRTNVNVGGNSVTYPALLLSPILHAGASQASGFKFPWWFGDLSEWSQVQAITGSNEPGADFWGNPRPATASKNSWGAAQFVDAELESTTVQTGSYGRVINDAGSKFVRRVLVDGSEITVTIYVRREANYAGNAVRMVIKQPGQTDQTTDMTAAVDTWEQLSDTLTPAASPGYVDVYVESRNTAVAGNYAVFYDTMDVV